MNTRVLGSPQEWFNDSWIYSDQASLGCRPPRLRGLTDINAYVDDFIDEGGGVAGIELSVFQAMMLQELIDGPFDPDWLAASFYLRRRDVVAQAISLYKSVSSNRFHSYQDGEVALKAFRDVEYDRDGILHWTRFLLDSERRFEEMFEACRIAPASLFYEDLQSDPLGVLGTIARAVGVEAPVGLPDTTLTIMRDDQSSDWGARILADLPEDLRDSLQARSHL